MFIRVVDEGLERYLREHLPLSEDVGDISFDTPSRTWGAGISRPTVNLFLFDINRSAQPNQAAIRRIDADGRREKRPPQPMVEMNYLVSAWAGGARDEHQLLGDVLSLVAPLDVLPPEYLPTPLSSSVHVAFIEDERLRARDIWNGAGGTLKASFSLQVTVAAESFGWSREATGVSSIQGITSRA